MNIANIISFIYIQRLKNFNKAAKKLYITQPSLTSRIKTLEKELGVRLFNRDNKHVELSEEGHIFLPYAIDIYNSYLKAKTSLQKSTSTITVGSIISVSTSILPNAVYQFQNRNHHLSFEIITAKTTTIIKKLLENECQIAITEKINNPDIISELVYLDNVSLFVSSTHPFRSINRKLSITDIGSEPLICFNPNSTYWNDILNSFRVNHLMPNIVFNIDSMEAAKSAIQNNIGIGFLPELSLEKDITTGNLYKVPMDLENDFKREITLSYLKNANQEIKELAEVLLYSLQD